MPILKSPDDVSPAGGALRPGAGPAGAMWKRGGGGGGGLKRAEGPAANERLPSLLQAPPLPGATAAPAPGQPRRHQDPGRLVGRAGAQREAKIHRHGQGGEQTADHHRATLSEQGRGNAVSSNVMMQQWFAPSQTLRNSKENVLVTSIGADV